MLPQCDENSSGIGGKPSRGRGVYLILSRILLAAETLVASMSSHDE